MVSASPYTLMSLKAFGDLVIARTSLASGPPGVRMAIAEHLLELNNALRPGPPPHIVAHGEHGVPALFDLRRRGVVRGLLSAGRLRQAVRRAGIADDATLVFDRVGTRELFIAGGRRTRALPAQENVYHAYAELLGGKHGVAAPISGGWRTAGIFPSSRVAAKNLPIAVVARLLDQCREAGLLPQVFLLDGERSELELAFPNATIVPRCFEAMAEAVRSAGAVISADSLPAHLAEHWQCPVFVVSPVDNRYWMPLSSYEHDRWALPESLADGRLTTFLAACTASAATPVQALDTP
jgi:hypothetical protein